MLIKLWTLFQGVSHQFEMFKEFVKANNPKDIMDVNEFLALRKEVRETLDRYFMVHLFFLVFHLHSTN